MLGLAQLSKFRGKYIQLRLEDKEPPWQISHIFKHMSPKNVFHPFTVCGIPRPTV